LGVLLRNEAKFDEAMACFQRALKLFPPQDPRRHSVQTDLSLCQRLKELDQKLPAVLKGDARPKTPEKVEIAFLCQQYKGRYAAASRLYAEAFAEQPALADDLKTGNRYNAACAAAQAAAGKGEDASSSDEKERARLRNQALEWLRADLTTWDKLADNGPPQARAAVQQTLKHWQEDSDLSAVRDPAALDKLPESERADWQKLWSDVDALLKKVGDGGQK
ncbi:MAG TPA: tetratricopeptide repeat protein, partial [Gemmataceae bacterium]|nr:tetratricopeptide repeat protein [Gemmataceae bacterium]